MAGEKCMLVLSVLKITPHPSGLLVYSSKTQKRNSILGWKNRDICHLFTTYFSEKIFSYLENKSKSVFSFSLMIINDSNSDSPQSNVNLPTYIAWLNGRFSSNFESKTGF